MKLSMIISFVAVAVLGLSCGSDQTAERASEPRSASKPPTPEPKETAAPVRPYTLVQKLPHDSHAFTQGLVVHDGQFFESTGQFGQSGVRAVNIMTGRLNKVRALGDQFFGEGMTVLNGKAYVLTWLKQRGFVFDVNTLDVVGTFLYLGEGWGLTTDGSVLYMSNGTDMIMVRDPEDFHLISTLHVKLNGSSQSDLNELEWIEGEIWANVWKTERIVRIDPATGRVNSVVDLTGILPQSERPPQADVLNGIAYDSTTKAIYVTGKNWPNVFQISVAE